MLLETAMAETDVKDRFLGANTPLRCNKPLKTVIDSNQARHTARGGGGGVDSKMIKAHSQAMAMLWFGERL
jgi:hypothetical protein